MLNKKECFKCKTTSNLHKHHIFYGSANRKQSDKHGMMIWLCGTHHNLSSQGIHFDKLFDLEVKRMAQEIFEKAYGHEKFMQIFGKNYL